MQLISNLHNWRAELSVSAKKDLNKLLTTKKIKANEILYSFGDVPKSGFQIISGKIKICNYHSDGREIIFAYFHPGDCCGDLGLISPIPRSNFAIACEDTEVNILKKNDFEKLCLSHIEILYSMIRCLRNRIDFLLNNIEESNLLSINERLAKLIIRLGMIQGRTPPEKTITIKDLSQEDISKMIGATRQSVGTELKRMEAAGVIRLEYKRIIIEDLDTMIKDYDNLISHETVIADYSDRNDFNDQ